MRCRRPRPAAAASAVRGRNVTSSPKVASPSASHHSRAPCRPKTAFCYSMPLTIIPGIICICSHASIVCSCASLSGRHVKAAKTQTRFGVRRKTATRRENAFHSAAFERLGTIASLICLFSGIIIKRRLDGDLGICLGISVLRLVALLRVSICMIPRPCRQKVQLLLIGSSWHLHLAPK